MKPLLMIVEDNDFTRRILATILNGQRYIFAKTGNEALSKFVENKPPMVFLDIELPDKSGIDILSAIMNAAPTTYVVMLSSHTDKDTIIHSIKLGARGFIAKPFSKGKLDEYIAKYEAEHTFS
jgi:DNA-binding response OmpR family regulator